MATQPQHQRLEVTVAGQWVEDSRHPSGWRWDPFAPAADPSPTNIMAAYAGGSAMTYSSRDYTTELTSQPRGDAGGLVSYDPDDPHDPTLEPDGPATWTGSEPAVSRPETWTAPASSTPDLVACPTCGGGVHPDRLRES